MAVQDKEVDFSNYFKNQTKNNKSVNKPKSSAKTGNLRLVILMIVLVGLGSALAYVVYHNQQGKTIILAPPGYHISADPTQPIHFEKNK